MSTAPFTVMSTSCRQMDVPPAAVEAYTLARLQALGRLMHTEHRRDVNKVRLE